MAKIYNNREIVELLNGEGLTSSTGKPFTLEMISWIRYKHRIPGPLPPAGTLTVRQVRQRYGVSLWVVHYWIQRHIVPATQAECTVRDHHRPGSRSAPSKMGRKFKPSSSIIPNANCMRCIMPGVSG